MTDVLTLLSEANPVRVEDLAALDRPDLVLRRPRRRIVVAVALVGAALAASLIGVFVSGGSPPRSVVVRSAEPTPTIARPLPRPTAREVSLQDAAAALGAPIVLPDTSLVGRSDVGAVWIDTSTPVTDVAVTFPAQGIIVQYSRPVFYPKTESVSALYESEAKSNPGTSVTDLNGVPALATEQNSDQTEANFGSIEFVAHGTVIGVLGHYDEASLKAIAQSIVDQARNEPRDGTINARPPGYSRLTLGFSRASGAITSIAVTVNAPSLGGTALLEVVRGSYYAPLSERAVVFRDRVPMTNIASPASGPPGTVALSTWSGTLSPSDWDGGCENATYVVIAKVYPGSPTQYEPAEAAKSGPFVCNPSS